MKKWLVILALLLPWHVQAAEEVYVTIDENGVPVFSDEKTPGSETVEIRETMVFDNPVKQRMNQRPTIKLSPEEEDGPAYNLAITDPPDDSAIRENSGTLVLTLAISPGMNADHHAELVMDGSPIRRVSTGGPVTLTNVDRGTHTFLVRVVDGNDKVIASSEPVRVSMLRHFLKKGS